MSRAAQFVRTTVGKKQLMAVSGIVLVGFVVGHMLGHLQVFLGREAYNAYAAKLKSLGPLLWVARLILLGAVTVHIVAALQIVARNRAARPVPYQVRQSLATNYAARTMRIGGPLLLLFILYHLGHFTLLVTGPGYSHSDVYGNMVAAFQVPWIAFVYIAAMVLLAMHLYHGVWSMLQTLGVDYPAIGALRSVLAPLVAVLIGGGYIVVPVAILLGLVK